MNPDLLGENSEALSPALLRLLSGEHSGNSRGKTALCHLLILGIQGWFGGTPAPASDPAQYGAFTHLFTDGCQWESSS